MRVCEYCGEELSEERLSTTKYCTKRCVALAHLKRFPKLRYEISLKREEILKIKGGQCYFCEKNEKIHIHHKNYENNDLKNLVLLCPQCHTKLHLIIPKISKTPNLKAQNGLGDNLQENRE